MKLPILQELKKRQIGLQPNTSPAPMYVFANVHLLEFFCKGYKCVSLTSSKCIHEVTWSCEVKLIWGYMCNCGTKSLVEGGKIQISKYFFSWSVVPFLLYPTYRSNIVGCGKKYKYISCYISIILSTSYITNYNILSK